MSAQDLERYEVLITQQVQLRDETDKKEEELCEEMDAIWKRLTEKERKLANQIAQKLVEKA